MIVQTFEQFAAARGASRQNFGDAGLHTRIHMSDRAHRAAMARQQALDADLAARRDALRVEYAGAMARGEIREPTSAELLEETSKGEGVAAEAARRVLERRAARAAA